MTTTDYDLLDAQLAALTENESDVLANCANFVALLFDALTDINWLGIYVRRNDELVLGPFQGKPACVHIPIGQGVCGQAADKMETLRVDNVHEFSGHIVCDIASRSEIVVPLTRNGVLLGVLTAPGRLWHRALLPPPRCCRRTASATPLAAVM